MASIYRRGTDDADDINGNYLDNLMYGEGGDDHLKGRSGDDRIFGGTGDDRLSGSRGSDTLRGELGNDTLFGGSDSDKLIGGLGEDRLIGCEGSDVFQFIKTGESTPGQPDVIKDFSLEERDRIDLSWIDADSLPPSNEKFDLIETQQFTGTRGELRYEHQGQSLLVEADTNGDAVADFAVILLGKFQHEVSIRQIDDRDFIL